MLPQVPATIAVHWNAAGVPNRFAPAWTQPLATVLFGAGIPLLIALTSLPGPSPRRSRRDLPIPRRGRRRHGRPRHRRLHVDLRHAGGLCRGCRHRPVWPARAAPASARRSLSGCSRGSSSPADAGQRAPATTATPLAIAPGERVVWLRTASMAPGDRRSASRSRSSPSSLAAFVAWLTGAPEGRGLAARRPRACCCWSLAATTVAFHVRVDDDGLRVASVLGIPRFRLRSRRDRDRRRGRGEPDGGVRRLGTAVERRSALRSRPARRRARSRSTRTNGKRFVVTVDDAGTGAALLQALVARDAAARP